MGKRKLAHISDSEDEKEDEDAEDEKGSKEKGPDGGAGGGGSDEESAPEAKPVGDVIKRIGRGKLEKCYYQAFELDGNRYELEDPVLVTPEERNQKPYVAIIKEIKQSKDGSVAITGQWFYRPEEAEKKGGGSWTSNDSRELFYSFHRDEVVAESVMHKCVVHFIPPNKQAPVRSKHPGFIVRRVYDTVEKKLFKLTDKDYEDSKQKELDLLVQKTRAALGELPDIEPEEVTAEQEEPDKTRRLLRRRSVLPLNVTREEHLPGEMSAREGLGRPDTPASCLGTDPASEDYLTLYESNALTGNKARDRWLEKLLQGVKKHVCNTDKNVETVGKASEDTANVKSPQKAQDKSEVLMEASVHEKKKEVPQVEESTLWPHAAIAAVTALERSAYETLSSDMHKYNLKMRQLEFNLKNGAVLATRLLKKELDSSTVLNMSPAELKDGLTAEEKSAQEPEEPETMQMADVRCTICGEKKVGVRDIIHVGYGDRYQLECLKCGNSWYSSRDSISSLSIQTVSQKLPVGTAPWATSKFEEVEKELLSPRDPGRLGAQDTATATATTNTENKSASEQLHLARSPRGTATSAMEGQNTEVNTSQG